MGWWGPYSHSPKSEPTSRQSEKLAQSQHILGCDCLVCVTKCHPAQLQVLGVLGQNDRSGFPGTLALLQGAQPLK